VAITFDDGYVDNVEAGLPILEACATPASVYVATGFVGRRIFWWDELHALLAGPGERPPWLDVAIGPHRLTAATDSLGDRRRALIEVVHPALRFADGETVEQGLAVLHEWAGPVEIPTDVVGRPVDSAELGRLAASDLIELGAHSVRHLSFPSLSRGVGRDEVSTSRNFVAEVAGRLPAGFSFPFGDNDPLSRSAVRCSGFDYAVGVGEPMPLTVAARRFELPRLVVIEEPASALADRMEAALAFRRLS
jgi:peptidoglycan/xylan/chitin deacetylase (PgdA/CDA1 family)